MEGRSATGSSPFAREGLPGWARSFASVGAKARLSVACSSSRWYPRGCRKPLTSPSNKLGRSASKAVWVLANWQGPGGSQPTSEQRRRTEKGACLQAEGGPAGVAQSVRAAES